MARVRSTGTGAGLPITSRTLKMAMPGRAPVMPSNDEEGTERRRDARRRTVRAVITRFDGPGSPIDCILLDISLGGARLHVHHTSEMPNQFQLHIEADAFTRQCEVVWRQANELGVKFI